MNAAPTETAAVATLPAEVAARLAAIRGDFWDDAATAAHLLCDRHDPEAVALRFVETTRSLRT